MSENDPTERLNYFDNGGKLIHFDVERGPADAPESFPLFSMPSSKTGREYADKIMDRFNAHDALTLKLTSLEKELESERAKAEYWKAEAAREKEAQPYGAILASAPAVAKNILLTAALIDVHDRVSGDICHTTVEQLADQIDDIVLAALSHPTKTGTGGANV